MAFTVWVMVCPAFRDKWWLIFGDVVRSRSGRLGEDKFHQPAGIFSVKASEGAAVSFLPPQGLENVHTAFQDAAIELSGVICLMALFA